MRTHLSQNVDYLVYSPSGELALAVEAKKLREPTVHWATAYRNGLVSSGGLSSETPFLLVTPEMFYLWKRGTELPAVINAGPYLGIYFAGAKTTARDVHFYTFQMTVRAWLENLALGEDATSRHFQKSFLRGAFTDGTVVASQSE
jgi:hypothetical protein